MLKCSNCGHENLDTSKFCGKCGSPLAVQSVHCTSCGAQLPTGTKFCPNCGSPVKEPPKPMMHTQEEFDAAVKAAAAKQLAEENSRKWAAQQEMQKKENEQAAIQAQIAAAARELQRKQNSFVENARKGLDSEIQDAISSGVDVEIKDSDGNTALIAAAASGKVSVIKILLNAGVNDAAVNNAGDTALIAASKAGQLESVETLLSSCTINNEVPEDYYVMEKREGDAKVKMEAAANVQNVSNVSAPSSSAKPVSIRTESGEINYELFTNALEDVDVNMVQQFIDAGADVNQRVYDSDTEADDTPLLTILVSHAKYAENTVKILEMMLNAGAEVDATDYMGVTALGRLTSRMEPKNDAEIKCVRRMIEILVEDYGADVNACDSDGRTNLHYANGPCRKILLEFGAED